MSEDEFLNEEGLETLVKESVLAAVEKREVPPRGSPENVVMVGLGARETIRRAVMSSVSELIGRQMLTAGPLKDAAEKVSKVSSHAEELWGALKAIEKSLEEEPEVEAVQPQEPTKEPVAAQEPAKDAKPGTPTPVETPAAVSETHDNIIKITVAAEHDDEKTPEPKKPEARQEPDKTAAKTSEKAAAKKPEDEETDIVVNGIKITFFAKSSPAFRAFFREFVGEILKGPVRPSWAIKRAQAHGWNVVRGTVLAQIENYLGDLSKWKDEDGEAWWSLPKQDGTPVGSTRRTR